MPLTAFAAFLTLAAQANPPAQDRSGEPALRQIMTWAKALDNVHFVIETEARDTGHDPMYPGERVDVWISGSKFRIEHSNYWGYDSYVVSDGSTVLSDSESESDPALLANAKEGLLATYADLKMSLDDISPFFALMEGPSKLDSLVEKTAAIKLEPGRGDEKVLSFEHKKLGTERLYYHQSNGSVQLDMLEYDNLPATQEQYKSNSEWMDPPDPGMLTRNTFYFDNHKPSPSLFDTKPPKGRQFNDIRKPPKKT
ncbi:MAG TPA: hypothetical protein VHE55_12085 [Fimbriimonadaceae bacterium]|nr:hypothetical protein [Fimbriimonadaceae bacterium]